MIGFGMAAAVFIDATIVRMMLVPSSMEVAGRACWWFPAWLGRLLPQIDIEGGDTEPPPPTPPVRT
jgi:RND superfamily putative drug exporter